MFDPSEYSRGARALEPGFAAADLGAILADTSHVRGFLERSWDSPGRSWHVIVLREGGGEPLSRRAPERMVLLT